MAIRVPVVECRSPRKVASKCRLRATRLYYRAYFSILLQASIYIRAYVGADG
jgi:hypothetical protein